MIVITIILLSAGVALFILFLLCMIDPLRENIRSCRNRRCTDCRRGYDVSALEKKILEYARVTRDIQDKIRHTESSISVCKSFGLRESMYIDNLSYLYRRKEELIELMKAENEYLTEAFYTIKKQLRRGESV